MFPIIYHNPINSNLTFIEGCPKVTGCNFKCLFNKLTSLEEQIEYIDRYLDTVYLLDNEFLLKFRDILLAIKRLNIIQMKSNILIEERSNVIIDLMENGEL